MPMSYEEAAHRYRVRTASSALLAKGVLKRQDCRDCGHPRSQMHHETYDDPANVIWLCAACHVREHVRLRALVPKPERVPGMTINRRDPEKLRSYTLSVSLTPEERDRIREMADDAAFFSVSAFVRYLLWPAIKPRDAADEDAA